MNATDLYDPNRSDRPMVTRCLLLAYNSAKKNAATRGINFNLSRAQVLNMLERSAYKCEVSGITFSVVRQPKENRRPWAPSIDRIDSSKGYTGENCRLVSVAANVAMNEWGLATLTRLAEGVIRMKDRRRQEREAARSGRESSVPPSLRLLSEAIDSEQEKVGAPG